VARRRTKPDSRAGTSWTPRQRKALEIEAVNFGTQRKTQQQIAEEVGVARSTLCSWHDLPGWAEERARLTNLISDEFRPAVIRANIESALLPGAQGAADRRLFFQLRGELKEKHEVELKDELRVVVDWRSRAGGGDAEDG